MRKPSQSTFIYDLPVEILFNILENLCWRDLARCTEVCLRWKIIAPLILKERVLSLGNANLRFKLAFEEFGLTKENQDTEFFTYIICRRSPALGELGTYNVHK